MIIKPSGNRGTVTPQWSVNPLGVQLLAGGGEWAQWDSGSTVHNKKWGPHNNILAAALIGEPLLEATIIVEHHQPLPPLFLCDCQHRADKTQTWRARPVVNLWQALYLGSWIILSLLENQRLLHVSAKPRRLRVDILELSWVEETWHSSVVGDTPVDKHIMLVRLKHTLSLISLISVNAHWDIWTWGERDVRCQAQPYSRQVLPLWNTHISIDVNASTGTEWASYELCVVKC